MTSTVTSPAQKDGLKKVMLAAFMSSEESGEESIDGETEKRSVLLVKPLLWRSPRLAHIFKQQSVEKEIQAILATNTPKGCWTKIYQAQATRVHW